MTAPLRLAMVGGGPGSFIGPVHRMAAELDGKLRLVAGAFSSDALRSLEAAATYGLPARRAYADYVAMFEREARLEEGAEAVAIVTPNHLHLPVALSALSAGLHVISDKPATATLAEALALRDAVRRSGRCYALTYTYTGYPMIRLARKMIAAGDYGPVRKVCVNYPQGWLAKPVERDGHRQAQWRTDPARAGVGGCIGDIGVHAFQLAEFVSGQRIERFVADLATVVEGRPLDDDCNLLLRFEGGQPGVLTASQISTGERNGMAISVYCENAGIEWRHERSDRLNVLLPGGETRQLHAGSGEAFSRLPAGHPEGFVEAFANVYSGFADAVRGETGLIGSLIPGIECGVRSLRFVEGAVAASRAKAGWTAIEEIGA